MLVLKSMFERKKILPLVMALANSIINKLGFVELINQTVAWDPDHWEEMGRFHEGKSATVYRGRSFSEEVCAGGWIRQSRSWRRRCSGARRMQRKS